MTSNTTAIAPVKKDVSPQNEKAGEFILALIQSLLRTGYYLSDHPEARKAKAGLYERFRALVQNTGEISFLIYEEQGSRSVAIDGMGERTLRPLDIMNRGMAEMYVPRFVQFMERKELLCFSITSRIGKEEFSRFIDIMSEPVHAEMQGAGAKSRFVSVLKLHNICNISFVFNEDLVETRLSVPWRTRVALSRLKKDLHLLPILRNMTNEELHGVKLQILSDILRPLALSNLVYGLLLHLDLAASPILSEEDAEKGVFSVISDAMILHVGKLFILDLLKSGSTFPENVTPQKIARLISGLSERLSIAKDAKAMGMLELMYNKGLITLDALPERIRKRILLIKRLATYLASPDRFLSSLEDATDIGKYAARSDAIAAFVPLLVECGRFDEAIAILKTFVRHAQEKSDRTIHALQRRASIAMGPAPRLAANTFLSASKESRIQICTFFRLLGHGAIPHLQRIIIESTDQWRSKQAAETLVSLGGKAVSCLISALDGNLVSGISLPVVLRVLGDCEPGAVKDDVVRVMLRYVKNSDREASREALHGLNRLQPTGNFPIFSMKSADEDIRIRRVCVSGMARSGDARALGMLQLIIEKADRNGSADDKELAPVAVEALAVFMDSCPEHRDAAFSYLSVLVDRYCEATNWLQLMLGPDTHSIPLILAVTEVLGRQHNKDVSRQLAKLATHHNPDVARRAVALSGMRHNEAGV